MRIVVYQSIYPLRFCFNLYQGLKHFDTASFLSGHLTGNNQTIIFFKVTFLIWERSSQMS